MDFQKLGEDFLHEIWIKIHGYKIYTVNNLIPLKDFCVRG